MPSIIYCIQAIMILQDLSPSSQKIIYNKNKVTGIKSSAFGGSALYKGLDLKVIK